MAPNLTSPRDAEKVEQLLRELEQTEPPSYDLGTPEVIETEATDQLVKMGRGIVPILLDQLTGDRSSKSIAYIVLVLNRLGDPEALVPLRALRERYRDKVTKDEWDYAVIGQCNLAINHLTKLDKE